MLPALRAFRRLRPAASPAFLIRRCVQIDAPRTEDYMHEREVKLEAKIETLNQENERLKAREVKLDAKIETMNHENERLETELSATKVKAANASHAAKTYLSKVSELLVNAESARGTFNIRTALEIIAEMTRFKASVEYPDFYIAPGVQPALDALRKGIFDGEGLTYADMQATLHAKLEAEGKVAPEPEDLEEASKTLYETVCRAELSGRQWPDNAKWEL
ncbi:hypothetical protein DFH06DRAFT_3152 [Mycena polygramma]|nr:hypothetical protein DFH06DRAFT_3152 [Mycena polygramma]